ncbi:MAG: hypothetical protein IPM02_25855 [Betaproteobacteria bacterium]|nr:hypothetical protein [Betaproteobacteria bacterium]
MTHDELAHSLAGHLYAPDRMVWEDLQLGPAGSPRPDVYTLEKSFVSPHPTAYECKVSRSDFLSDVTSGKWTSYRAYACRVIFAAEVGLWGGRRDRRECGLILLHLSGTWRAAKRAVVNPVEVPYHALLKLLIDGVERCGPKSRAKAFDGNNGFNKRFGAQAARWVADAASVKESVQRAEERRAIILQRADKDAAAICERARKDGGELWAKLLDVLGLPPDADTWTVRGAVNNLRSAAEGTVCRDMVARINGDLQRCARALDKLLNPGEIP